METVASGTTSLSTDPSPSEPQATPAPADHAALSCEPYSPTHSPGVTCKAGPLYRTVVATPGHFLQEAPSLKVTPDRPGGPAPWAYRTVSQGIRWSWDGISGYLEPVYPRTTGAARATPSNTQLSLFLCSLGMLAGYPLAKILCLLCPATYCLPTTACTAA